MREVDIALTKISVRQHNAHALRARLHGITIPFKNAIESAVDNAKVAAEKKINDDQADAVLKAALERKRKEKSGA